MKSDRKTPTILCFARQFLWSLIFLFIVVIAQVFVSLESFPGYPGNMWLDYFTQWWLATIPLIVLGMLLVSVSSKQVTNKYARGIKAFGRILIFIAVLCNYFSLLAMG